jgi:hypothetical protein
MAEPTQEEINRVINGYNEADEAADYADTIVCEMQQVSGDNYMMKWSTEYNGSFEPNK